MHFALKDLAVDEPVAPEGVVNQGGEWYFDEYAGKAGVRSISGDAINSVPRNANEEEKKSILDLFRR
jgi:penicillin-binding protein 1A